MKVLVFNHSFFYVSETFVYKQVTGMPADIDISLLGSEIVNEENFPVNCKKFKLKSSVNLLDRIVSAGLKKVFGFSLGLSIGNYFLVKKLLRREKIDLIHAHFGFNGLKIFPAAKSEGVPLVVTFHGLDASPEYLNKPEYKKSVKKLIDYARSIIIVSPHMIDTLELKQAGKIHLVPCCVDPSEFVNDNAPAGEKIRILHSGRLISKKGVPDLIKVFIELSKKHSNIQLDIIGDGPETALSKELAQGAANIKFYGARPHAEVKRFMSETNIFVLNSRIGENGDMEGMPVSILEAMSMQLPVVSTYHAGIPQAINNGGNGLLVNEKDNAALYAALEKLITDASLRIQLGKAARTTVEEKFTIEQMNQKIADTYRS